MAAMGDVATALAERGIRLRNHAVGAHRTTCPWCSHKRGKKREPCLSVKIDGAGGAVWKCHHCGESGNVLSERGNGAGRPVAPPSGRRPKAPKRRRNVASNVASENMSRTGDQPGCADPLSSSFQEGPADLPPEIVAWFKDERGISQEVLRRNRIGYGPVFIPAKGNKAPAIHFPFLRAGEVVNVKYRTLDKQFAKAKGGDTVFYGLDDVMGQSEIIIVEGEIDKLSLEEAGFRNTVSIPDGAPTKINDADPADDGKFEYMRNCSSAFEEAEKIILALDDDGPGHVLSDELARRFGKERCWRVTWPGLGDAPRKDANEVLVHDGAEVLKECVESAVPYPVSGMYTPADFLEEVLALYRTGGTRGLSTGWLSLDRHLTIRPGDLSVVTGVPGAGKSEFLDSLMVNMAHEHGWRFACCSFENLPEEHLARLAEKHLDMPFWEGPAPRMGEGELLEAMSWAEDHFVFLRADDESPTIDWILERARVAAIRHGINGLVIDPYNEIEHKRLPTMNETEYVSEVLGKVKRFGQNHEVHVWFVAHPAKMHPETRGEDRVVPPPLLYDISGSAHWVNKADVGLTVHRRHGSAQTDVYIRKVRSKAVGQSGTMVTFDFNRATGKYSEASSP